MGVTGLWTVVQPCARPIKIETLNKKRLAVDASIWIYQFLKAVRDKEGNALRNSHIVGFFRRICKLLFIGIKPVFVFDGGAPVLKRQTVSGRKARREGRREDAVRTAGKLLALQMQRRAEEDDRKARDERERPAQDDEGPLPDNLVYVDELQMTPQERQQSRTFKKKDQYHLPNLDVDLADMGAPDDPRIMSHEELEEYARQFHTGEDVNVYDFSKIDFESPFFLSLPASDRYNILNAARLRSRLRMGHSKEQLDDMFPNRMDFSRFQIQRVKERNELTQRLMNINGMNGEEAMFGINNPGRVAGERGKEYVLVKNDGVEGGWALGVVSNRGEGERSNPVDVERLGEPDSLDEAEDDAWENDGFEDVPIEGLNRLPKRSEAAGVTSENTPFASEELKKRRRAVYEARMGAAGLGVQDGGEEEEADSLFMPQAGTQATEESENADDLFEDVLPPVEGEDEDLNRAIAMSLEQQEDEDADETAAPTFAASAKSGPRIDRPLDFNQKNARAGRDAAHLVNNRAHGSAPKPFAEDSDDEEDGLGLQAASEESRRSKHKPHSGPRVHNFKNLTEQARRNGKSVSKAPIAKPSGHVTFDGPLPFESLSLGKSLLGQKKKKPAEEQAGGFEKDAEGGKKAQPTPPWFTSDIREETAKQKAIEERQFERGDPDQRSSSLFEQAKLRRQDTREVIDVDAPKQTSTEVIAVDDDYKEGEDDDGDFALGEVKPVDSEVRMGDIADVVRAEPPISEMPTDDARVSKEQKSGRQEPAGNPSANASESDEEIEWSASDHEDHLAKPTNGTKPYGPAGGHIQKEASRSPSLEFENVGIIGSPAQPQTASSIPEDDPPPIPILPEGQSTDGQFLEDVNDGDGDFSDPEDEDLMRQLAIEAEEHARFASTLNSKSQLQNAEDYEKELRQLRNQQKKDRRDAEEVTHIMVTECQQLLQLFGLPYITAPMEAEAQCAELVSLNLVDGIVTDDSDIFLFGGTRVYKNMFNQSKFVECYLASDLEKEYALDRQKLIRFAHLLGSDYTEGIPSVGPVTALEILSDFDTIEAFADWFSTVQMGQPLTSADAANPFRRKFRKNAAKIFLPNPFPDTRVDLAYLHPEVDSDPQAFAWGVPDLDRLRQFLMATIGWSQERTDEVLVPVIKDMNRREKEGTQANITQFFSGSVGVGAGPRQNGQQGFAPQRRAEAKSRRMENALGRMHERAREKTRGEGEGEGEGKAGSGNDDQVDFDDADGIPVDLSSPQPQQDPQKPKPKSNPTQNPTPNPPPKAKAKNKRPAAHSDLSEDSDDDSADEDGEYRAPSKARKKTAKGRKRGH